MIILSSKLPVMKPLIEIVAFTTRKIKFIWIALFFSCCFISCSKNKNSSSDNYIRGKMGGVAFECTSNIKANSPEPGASGSSDPTIRISGEWSGHSVKLYVNEATSSLTNTTYIFEAGKNRSGTIIENSVTYSGGSSSFCLGCPLLVGSGKITILEISKKDIRGTFEFITAADPVTGTSRTVTDGDFNIKRE